MPDCTAIEPLLLDFVYGEISAADRARCESHLARCAACAAAVEGMRATRVMAHRMPMEAPPRDLAGPALRAVASRARGSAAPIAGPRRWFVALAQFAMGPQVAMAAMLVLMVGVGLFLLRPESGERGQLAQRVLDPAHGGEAVPGPAVQPASPIELDIDPRTKRLRVAASPARQGAAAPVEREAAPPPMDVAEPATVALEEVGDRAVFGGDEDAQERRAAAPASVDGELALGRALDRPEPSPAGAPPAPAVELRGGGGTGALSARASEGEGNAMQGFAGGSIATAADAVAMEEGFARPVAPPPTAAPVTATAAPARPAATRARTESAPASSEACSARLAEWRRTGRTGATPAVRGAAWLAAAECLARVGRVAEARSAYAEAARFDVTRDRAREGLGRLTPAEATQPTSTAPASERP